MNTPPDLDPIKNVGDLEERARLVKEAREVTNTYLPLIRQLRDDTYAAMRDAGIPVRRAASLLGISTSTGEEAYKKRVRGGGQDG